MKRYAHDETMMYERDRGEYVRYDDALKQIDYYRKVSFDDGFCEGAREKHAEIIGLKKKVTKLTRACELYKKALSYNLDGWTSYQPQSTASFEKAHSCEQKAAQLYKETREVN